MLTDVAVETTETSREEAEDMGAIAFFGDKYGSSVRVVRAGSTSLEFCGGTHVDSLGQIGPITLLSEGSIGSNTRRIFAVTGRASLDRALERERLVQSAAELLRTEPDELLAAIGRLAERQREAEKELARLRQQSSEAEAKSWPRRPWPTAAWSWPAATTSSPMPCGPWPRPSCATTACAPWCSAARPTGPRRPSWPPPVARPTPPSWCARSGAMVGGGGGGSAEVAMAGGKDPSQIEAALAEAQRLLVRVSDDGAGRGPGRVAALDLGARRIGVAFSDSRRSLASPWGTIERSGDPVRDRNAVVERCARWRR